MSDFKEIVPLIDANMHVARWTAGRADGQTDNIKVTSVDGNYVRAPKD